MSEDAPKKRGRPRSEQVDAAILRAAQRELVRTGFHGMNVATIAERAGVSKVSLYRRWRGKHALAEELFRRMGTEHAPRDHGSLEADVRALYVETLRAPDVRTSARILMRTMGEIAASPTLLASYRTHLLAPRIAQARALVERARGRGEIDPAITTEAAAALIAGPLFLHHLLVLAELDVDVRPSAIDTLVRTLLTGLSRPAPERPRARRRRAP